MQCIEIHCIPMAGKPMAGTPPRSAGATAKEDDQPSQVVHHNAGNVTNHPEVRTMATCVACGAELEPPVRAPHTVYVKTLYRIGGQDYCRHHIIRAAVAAGIITEIKPGAGPVAVVPRGAHSAGFDQPHQH